MATSAKVTAQARRHPITFGSPARRRRNLPLAVGGALVVLTCALLFALAWMLAGHRQRAREPHHLGAWQPPALACKPGRPALRGASTSPPACRPGALLHRPLLRRKRLRNGCTVAQASNAASALLRQ
jgi:hypothetical protein